MGGNCAGAPRVLHALKHFRHIEIIVIGGTRDTKLATEYSTKLVSYADVISQARTELSALVRQLQAA